MQIVKDWMKTKGDTGKRKTFVNTTLGETWEAKIGERPDAEVMAERKEHYSAPVPDRVAYLTAGIDSQRDRYEMRVWGWGPGEESWLIDRQIIMGRHDDEQTLLLVQKCRYPVSAGILAGLTRPLCMNARKSMGCSG
ncbi:phage DNA packaging protein large subunit [Shigella sonnei]|nr:phage DNA packaging protein large subunit [Shigella sonnei]